jgi:hypothetical protein
MSLSALTEEWLRPNSGGIVRAMIIFRPPPVSKIYSRAHRMAFFSNLPNDATEKLPTEASRSAGNGGTRRL